MSQQHNIKDKVGAMTAQDVSGHKVDEKKPKTEAERTGGGNTRMPEETQHSTDTGERKPRTNAPASNQPSGGTTAPKS